MKPLKAVANVLLKPPVASVLGIASVVIVLGGALITAVAYVGAQGERYSPANHLVSELGDTEISRLAIVFNVSLVIGGFCTLVFMSGLGIVRGWRGRARLGGLFGAVASIGGMLVGVFPINFGNGVIHVIVAFVFFGAGLVAITLFTLDFWLRPDATFSNRLAIPGLLSMMLSTFFLVFVFDGLPDVLWIPFDRPAVWSSAEVEWLALLGMLMWTGIVAVMWRRAIGRVRVAQATA